MSAKLRERAEEVVDAAKILREENRVVSLLMHEQTLATPRDFHSTVENIVDAIVTNALAIAAQAEEPIPMLIVCPACNERHVDEGEFATKRHHTHACQFCGTVWRPAIVATVGVHFLPGFKNP